MHRKIENYLKIFLTICSMVFLIYIGSTSLKKFRIDFTEEEIFTLSDGSKKILSQLDSRIQLKLFYSKTAANKGTEGLRTFNNHFKYIEELLEQYVSNSRNNITLEVIDPRPDTPEEEEAMSFGLKKFNLTETETYFFGLVAKGESGSEKIIDFFDPNRKDKLEYEITKLIYTVLNPQKKNVGILSSLNVLNEELEPYMAQIMKMQGKHVNDSWIVTKLLKEFYNVKKIENNSDHISGLDMLVIIHPKNFAKKTLFAIDQYLMQGGKILVFTDPAAVSDNSGNMMGAVSSSPDESFKKIMVKWGIEAKVDEFAGDRYLSGAGRFNPNQPTGRLIALLNCDKNCVVPHKEAISSGVENSMFVFPGALKKIETKGLNISPILSTTSKGNVYNASPFELNDPQSLWNKFQDGKEPVVIAYKSIGKFQTAFPDGIKSDVKDEKDKKNFLKESVKESAVVVFSDVDFLHDQFAFQQSMLGIAAVNGNSTLFLNSVEALTGDTNLLAVRSKSKINRSFDVINQIEFEAEKRTAGKVEQINASILKFQNELNEIGQKANDGNIALIQNEGIAKKKELSKQIALLKKDLREVKRQGREQIEFLGKIFQYANTMLMPILITIFAVFYLRKRSLKHEYYSRMKLKNSQLNTVSVKG